MKAAEVLRLDLTKKVFQACGVAANGGVIIMRKLRCAQVLPCFASAPACLVGTEACASAHHWARALMTLGDEVRLIPPAPKSSRSVSMASDMS